MIFSPTNQTSLTALNPSCVPFVQALHLFGLVLQELFCFLLNFKGLNFFRPSLSMVFLDFPSNLKNN